MRFGRERIGQVEAYLPLSELQWYALTVLASAPGRAYEIPGRIKEIAEEGMRLQDQNLYDRLTSMSLIGLIDTPETVIMDSRRRMYEITNLGREVLQADTERFERRLLLAKTRGYRNPNS